MRNVLGTLAQQIQQFLDAYERSAVLLERIVVGQPQPTAVKRFRRQLSLGHGNKSNTAAIHSV